MKNQTIYRPGFCEIVIPYKGEIMHAQVSRKDLPKVRKHNWGVWKKPSTRSKKVYYYVACKVPCSKSKYKQKTLYLHHLIVGSPKNNMVVDHKDRDTMNNTRSNLRIVTRRENVFNSEFRGYNKMEVKNAK